MNSTDSAGSASPAALRIAEAADLVRGDDRSGALAFAFLTGWLEIQIENGITPTIDQLAGAVEKAAAGGQRSQ
jgi:hypothetical protein